MDQILEALNWTVANPARLIIGLEFLAFGFLGIIVGDFGNMRIPYGKIFLRNILSAGIGYGAFLLFEQSFNLDFEWAFVAIFGGFVAGMYLQRPWRW